MRNKRRSIATAVAITMGFTGFVLATGYIIRVEKYLRLSHIYIRYTGHLAIYKKGAFERNFSKPERDSLSNSEIDQIREILKSDPNIENTGRFLRGNGLVSNGYLSFPFVAIGIDPEVDHYLRNHPLVHKVLPEIGPIKKGRTLFQASDTPDAVVMSQGLARLLGKEDMNFDEPPYKAPLNPTGQNCDKKDRSIQLVGGTYAGSFSATDGTLTGFFSTANAELEEVLLLTSVATLQKLFDTDKLTYMTVYLKDDSNLKKRATDLEALLRSKGIEVDVKHWNQRAIAPNYTGFMGFLTMLGAFIYGVLSVVVGISIINTSTLSVIERGKEIGTLRAIGFKTKHIISLFMHETFILVIFCMVSSAIVSTIFITLINKANIRFSPPGVSGSIQFLLELTPLSVIVISMSLIVVALLSTLLGVRKKVKKSIISSL